MNRFITKHNKYEFILYHFVAKPLLLNFNVAHDEQHTSTKHILFLFRKPIFEIKNKIRSPNPILEIKNSFLEIKIKFLWPNHDIRILISAKKYSRRLRLVSLVPLCIVKAPPRFGDARGVGVELLIESIHALNILASWLGRAPGAAKTYEIL